jgi:hypothetical protein
MIYVLGIYIVTGPGDWREMALALGLLLVRSYQG